MLLRLRMSLMKPRRLHRGIAIFFLIFTFADLSFADILAPQLCEDREELPGLSQAVTSDATSVAPDRVSLTAADSSRTEHPSQPTGIEDDCFCCCSHIIPGSHVTVADLSDHPRPSALQINALPSSPPQDTFHPPRLS